MATAAHPAVKAPATARKVAKKAPAKPAPPPQVAQGTTLTITSKNYSSWSLRGWLLARFAGAPWDQAP